MQNANKEKIKETHKGKNAQSKQKNSRQKEVKFSTKNKEPLKEHANTNKLKPDKTKISEKQNNLLVNGLSKQKQNGIKAGFSDENKGWLKPKANKETLQDDIDDSDEDSNEPESDLEDDDIDSRLNNHKSKISKLKNKEDVFKNKVSVFHCFRACLNC